MSRAHAILPAPFRGHPRRGPHPLVRPTALPRGTRCRRAVRQHAWLAGPCAGLLLALLAWDSFNLDLECTRAQQGCTSRHLLGSEFFPLSTLGPAVIRERQFREKRSNKVRTSYAVVVPGLSSRSGLSGGAIFVSADPAEARSTAHAFNDLRVGRSGQFTAQADGSALAMAVVAFSGMLVLTAVAVAAYTQHAHGGASPHVRLLPHHVSFQPLPTEWPSLVKGRERTVHRLRQRWTLDALGHFQVHGEPGREGYTLQVVSSADAVYDVCEGTRAALEPVADALNARLEHLRAHDAYA